MGDGYENLLRPAAATNLSRCQPRGVTEKGERNRFRISGTEPGQEGLGKRGPDKQQTKTSRVERLRQGPGTKENKEAGLLRKLAGHLRQSPPFLNSLRRLRLFFFLRMLTERHVGHCQGYKPNKGKTCCCRKPARATRRRGAPHCLQNI